MFVGELMIIEWFIGEGMLLRKRILCGGRVMVGCLFVNVG